MRTAFPAHCALIFFHFLPPFRLRKRLPALSREINRLPCDPVAVTGRPDGPPTSRPAPGISATTWPVMTWPTLADSVWSCAAAQLQTESANVGQVITGQVVAEIPGAGRDVGGPSGLPVTATGSHGKRFISLDNAGNLFLSR